MIQKAPCYWSFFYNPLSIEKNYSYKNKKIFSGNQKFILYLHPLTGKGIQTNPRI